MFSYHDQTTRPESMLSTRRKKPLAVAVALSAALAVAGCAGDSGAGASHIPSVDIDATWPKAYTTLDDLAAESTAIVEVRPTGKTRPLNVPSRHGGEPGDEALTVVEVEIVQVLGGSITDKVIEIVSPGQDESRGTALLTADVPTLLFLTPGVWEAKDPIGAYVVTGGPHGMFVKSGKDSRFDGLRGLDKRAEDSVDLADPETLPAIKLTEQTVIDNWPEL